MANRKKEENKKFCIYRVMRCHEPCRVREFVAYCSSLGELKRTVKALKVIEQGSNFAVEEVLE